MTGSSFDMNLAGSPIVNEADSNACYSGLPINEAVIDDLSILSRVATLIDCIPIPPTAIS